MAVRLNLNNPEFQRQWFALQKEDKIAVLNACAKIAGLDWNQLYRDQGLHWELIQTQAGPESERMYSIRVTKKIRAVVKRVGDFLEFLTLHPGHDSAYH